LLAGTGKNWCPRLAAVSDGIGAAVGAPRLNGPVERSHVVWAGTIIFTAGMITLVTADLHRPERRVSGRRDTPEE
jgi:hypothetical protein